MKEKFKFQWLTLKTGISLNPYFTQKKPTEYEMRYKNAIAFHIFNKKTFTKYNHKNPFKRKKMLVFEPLTLLDYTLSFNHKNKLFFLS